MIYNGDFTYDGTEDYSDETSRLLEYFADFDAVEGYKLRNASISIRPDAISSDYRTSFTPGPTEQGDVSEGVIARLWRIRVVGHRVLVSKADQLINV